MPTAYDITDTISSPALLGGGPVPGYVITDAIAAPAVLAAEFPGTYVIGEVLLSPSILTGGLTTPFYIGSVISSVAGFGGNKLHWAGRVGVSIHAPAVVVSGFSGNATFGDTIHPIASLTALFITVRSEATYREATYERTGYRVSFPLLVYALNTKTLADIAAVPPNRSFLVSGSFVPSVGDPFSENGAGANYIGTKALTPAGQSYLAFRKPDINETIWDVPSRTTYRFTQDRQTGVVTWQVYRTLPQRALDGQAVFAILDPEGVYNYYAQMMGAMYTQWAYDLDVLANQIDASVCSHFLLPFLAAQFGLTYNATDSLLARRQQVETAVPVFKFKGTPEGVILRIQSLGFRGQALEMWINPGDPTCSVVADSVGSIFNVPMASSSVFITVFGLSGGAAVETASGTIAFRSRTLPSQGQTVTISDGTTVVTFEFTNVAPAPGNVAVAIDPDVTVTLTNLVTAINGSALAVTATDITKPKTYGPPIRNLASSSTRYGTRVAAIDPDEYRLYPHNYWTSEIPVYVLSSRVVIVLTNLDGSPLQFGSTPQGHADALALKERVANNLQFDVLPAHVDVAFFATAVNAAGPTVIEKLELSELASIDFIFEVTVGSDVDTGPTPLSVNFTATPVGGTGPYTYAWDFGDSFSSTSQNPNHVYSSFGAYVATVTVTDSLGRLAMGSKTITPTSPTTSPMILLFTAAATGQSSDQEVSWNPATPDWDNAIVPNSGDILTYGFYDASLPIWRLFSSTTQYQSATGIGASWNIGGSHDMPGAPEEIIQTVNLEAIVSIVGSSFAAGQLYRSIDSFTWVPPTTPPGPNAGNVCSMVAIPPEFVNDRILAVSSGTASGDAGGVGALLWASDDAGDTWYSVTLPATMPAAPVAITRAPGSYLPFLFITFLAGQQPNVIYSNDLGDTWTLAPAPNESGTYADAVAMCYNPNTNIWYAIGWYSGDNMNRFYSWNGATFDPIPAGNVASNVPVHPRDMFVLNGQLYSASSQWVFDGVSNFNPAHYPIGLVPTLALKGP